MQWGILALNSLLSVGGVSSDPRITEESIFWGNRNIIQTSDIAGGNIETIVSTGLNTPADIEVDPLALKIYWSDLGNRRIKRANFDGSNIEELVPIGIITGPIGLALDVGREKMYWADRGGSRIQRANLDGSSIETIVDASSIGGTYRVCLDPDREHIYWTTNGSTSGRVWRANLEGDEVTLITQIDRGVTGLALDLENDRMFIGDDFSNVWSTGLDGSNSRVEFQLPESSRVLDIEWESSLNYMYIADNSATRIWRARSDGSELSAIVDLADPPPWNLLGLAVYVPEPAPVIVVVLMLFWRHTFNRRIN
ncbi:MAG TPA: hypothetical protein VJZ71_01845 [Phycisphaerae bacterium]|nr:hypothetical protein [Phycisphaerae bacterium]